MSRLWMISLIAGLALIVSGCNFYGGIDSPSGDAQYASAAATCLDQGDYACALSNYQKMSSAYSDISNSGSAYATFDQYGATFGAFAQGFGNLNNANIGAGLTVIANSILPYTTTTGSSTSQIRLNIYKAFLQYTNINDNPSLRSMVEFLGAVSFAGEILSEIASDQGATSLTKSLVTSQTVVPCLGTFPSGSTTLGSASVTTTIVQSQASLDLLNAAFQSMGEAITNLAANGSLASSFNGAIKQSLDVGCFSGGSGTTASYDTALITMGVGTLP